MVQQTKLLYLNEWLNFMLANYTTYFAKKKKGLGIQKKNLETSIWLFEYGLGHLMQIYLFVNVK